MLVTPSVGLPWGVASHAVEFTNYYNQYPFPLKSFTICLMRLIILLLIIIRYSTLYNVD